MDLELIKQTVADLLAISKPAAPRRDFIQGGGGNTSAKGAHGLMAIKASGFELRQMDALSGFAFVEHKPVTDYFYQVAARLDQPIDFEKESGDLVKSMTKEVSPYAAARPSMETGFHSILHKYVVHTHSVYSNLINCQADAHEVLDAFAASFGQYIELIPYYNPGFWLTTAIQQAIDQAIAAGRPKPQVYFLQNHGIIVSADTIKEVNQLHHEVNEALCDFFGISHETYPVADIVQAETGNENHWQSNSTFIKDFFRGNHTLTPAYFEANVLFPDQTVFFNGNFSFDLRVLKNITVDTVSGAVHYHTNFREARVIDETLTAYLYIRSKIEAIGARPRFLAPQDLDYINNMESEKFRKSLLK